MEIFYGKCGIGRIKLKLEPIGKCSRCRKNSAIIEIRYAKQKLCQSCFNNFFINRIRRVVEEFKMFNKNERVAVAVSGGKDSVALLHALKTAFKDQDIFAFYINLGINYYSDHLEKKVIKLCEDLKIPLEIYNLKEKEGYTIDEFLITKYKDKMCSVCGTIKRNIFTLLSVKVNANVLATGHNLDDTVSTMMSLFLIGDFEAIRKLKPVLKPLLNGYPRKIKPLITTPEIEDLYYVSLNELPLQECSCPHGEITPIKQIKNWIDELEKTQPDIKFRLLSIFRKKIIPLYEKNLNEELEDIKACSICSMPSNSEICSKCKRVLELKEYKQKLEDLKIEIDYKELQKMLKENNVIVIDVRSSDEMNELKIENSINIPSEEIEKHLKNLLKFKKTHKIVLYCNSGRKSYTLTIRLRNMGFKAYNLKDGILALNFSDYENLLSSSWSD